MNIRTALITIGIVILISGCKDQKISSPSFELITSNVSGQGNNIEIKFYTGKHHNYPTFSFWVEDVEGNYIETLFVTKYLGSGIYGYGSLGEGKWDNKPGEARRPATLPYWLHKRGIKTDGTTYLPTPQQPVPDAITGATPKSNFLLQTQSTEKLPHKFRLLMEINQPWDWNEFWNNSLYPDDADYKSSCQPALIYAVIVDQSKSDSEFFLNPIGHAHYAGKDGDLYTDLSSITTAKEIVHKVSVRFKE